MVTLAFERLLPKNYVFVFGFRYVDLISLGCFSLLGWFWVFQGIGLIIFYEFFKYNSRVGRGESWILDVFVVNIINPTKYKEIN